MAGNNDNYLRTYDALDVMNPAEIAADAATTPSFYGDKLGFDIGDITGENSFLNKNKGLWGLADVGFDWWNDSQNRKETKRLNDFKMDTTRKQMAMTQNAYDNNLARSKNGALDGVKSVDSRQYMNPNSQQAQQQGLAAAPAPQAPQTPQIPRRTPTRTGL